MLSKPKPPLKILILRWTIELWIKVIMNSYRNEEKNGFWDRFIP